MSARLKLRLLAVKKNLLAFTKNRHFSFGYIAFAAGNLKRTVKYYFKYKFALHCGGFAHRVTFHSDILFLISYIYGYIFPYGSYVMYSLIDNTIPSGKKQDIKLYLLPPLSCLKLKFISTTAL